MKFLIVSLALVAAACADVSHIVKSSGSEVDATVVRNDANVETEAFQYNYETSNGISGQAAGQLKSVGDGAAVVVQGSNQYTAPDGTPIQISYTADENGYQPQGAHLPTPPPTQPIPDYIIRSLEYIRTHPPKEDLKSRF